MHSLLDSSNSKNLSVLLITPFFPPDIGGISTHTHNVFSNLTERNIRVEVLAPKHALMKYKIAQGEATYRVTSLYLPGWPYSTLRSFSIPLDFGLSIISRIKKGNFDVVHVHGHHYPITWLALYYAHKHRIPSILTLHGMYALNPNKLGGESILENWFNRLVFSRLLKKTSGVIGLTDIVTAYARGFGPKSISYYTVGNGVNTALFRDNTSRKLEFRLKYRIGEESAVILFIGRLEHAKGVLEFTRASKRLIETKKDVEVLIVGSGSLESEVKATIGDTSRFHFMGWQSPEKIHEIYIASDIFALPSKFEALPITLIEAMNASLHIVFTPVGGITDALSGYSNKTLLTNPSEEKIYDVLNSLLERKTFNSSLHPDADFRYAQSFDWSNVVDNLIRIYHKLIDD